MAPGDSQPSGESAPLFVVHILICLLGHHHFRSFADPSKASVPWRTPGASHALPRYIGTGVGLVSREVAPKGRGQGRVQQDGLNGVEDPQEERFWRDAKGVAKSRGLEGVLPDRQQRVLGAATLCA